MYARANTDVTHDVEGCKLFVNQKKGGGVEPIAVGEKGYLDKLRPGKYELGLSVDKGRRFYSFRSNEKHNAIKIDALPPAGNDERWRFSIDVEVHSGDNGRIGFTKAPGNQIRAIRFSNNGVMYLYEISIVGQDGDFWLVVQNTWCIRAYENPDGSVALPALSKWETLMKLLSSERELLGKLPPVAEYNAEEETETAISPAGLKEMEAVVEFFSPAQGYGVVALHNGQKANIHWSDCPQRENGMRYVLKGENVSYGWLAEPQKQGQRESLRDVTLIEAKAA